MQYNGKGNPHGYGRSYVPFQTPASRWKLHEQTSISGSTVDDATFGWWHSVDVVRLVTVSKKHAAPIFRVESALL